MSRQLNEDQDFGHHFFASALDLGLQAERQAQPDGRPAEAKRLYHCAIADTELALAELAQPANREWARDYAPAIAYMTGKLHSWTERITKL